MLRRLPNPGTARRLTLGGLVAVVLALGASLLPALPAHAAGSTIHALVQQARAAEGLPGLTRNAALDAVAADWAASMAASGTLAHNPSYSAQIPGGWTAAGENVAQGQPTEAAMHDAWMSSAGHRANILGGFTDVGIAFLEAGGTTWGVEVFAAYPSAAPAPTPAAPETAAPAPAPESAPAPAPAEQPAASTPASPPATVEDRTDAGDAAGLETEALPEEASATEPTRGTTHRATRTSSTTATPAAGSAESAGPGGWLWVGVPSVAALAVGAGGVVLLRTRGLIGPTRGRHSA